MRAILRQLDVRRLLGLTGLLVAALTSGACFQMATVVKVKGDGSGTIDHQMLITTAALAQLRQFAQLAGGRGGGQNFDMISEEQARAMAANLGPGVTYVSSRALTTPDGEGRAATYAFTDISQLRISQQPEAPGGIGVRAQGINTDAGTITCSLTHEANGNAVLHINLPEPTLPLGIGDGNGGQNPAMAAQIAMVKSLLAGARLSVTVEPAGALVRTSSPYVDGQRVTLIDVNLDQLLGNETLLAKLQAAKGLEDVKAALKDAPGVKMNFDREITIEFTPAK